MIYNVDFSTNENGELVIAKLVGHGNIDNANDAPLGEGLERFQVTSSADLSEQSIDFVDALWAFKATRGATKPEGRLETAAAVWLMLEPAPRNQTEPTAVVGSAEIVEGAGETGTVKTGELDGETVPAKPKKARKPRSPKEKPAPATETTAENNQSDGLTTVDEGNTSAPTEGISPPVNPDTEETMTDKEKAKAAKLKAAEKAKADKAAAKDKDAATKLKAKEKADKAKVAEKAKKDKAAAKAAKQKASDKAKADKLKEKEAKAKARAKAKGEKKPKKMGEPRPGTKKAKLLALVSRDGGATMKEMLNLTGWKACLGTAREVVEAVGKKLVIKKDPDGKKATRWVVE